MPHRHAVDEAREVQREVRHVQHAFVNAAAYSQQRHALVAENGPHHRERKLVVSGGHRRMRGEHTSLAHRLEIRVVQLEVLARVQLPLEELQRQQGGVSLVEVIDHSVVVAQRLEHRRATHAEHDLLAQPIVLVAAVQAVRERAVPLAVAVDHRIEQEHGDDMPAHAGHLVFPHGHLHRAALDRHGAARIQALELRLRLPVHGRLALLPVGVEMLNEVALAVQQRDRDERDAEVGGGPERITCEHSEAATIRGDRLLEAYLHGKVGDGASCRRGTSGHEFLELYRFRDAAPAPVLPGAGVDPLAAVKRRGISAAPDDMALSANPEFYPGDARVQPTETPPSAASTSTSTGMASKTSAALTSPPCAVTHPP